jgi:hypothetical protein
VGHLSQPQAEGRRPSLEIVRQSTDGFKLRFLDDVGGVYVPPNLCVQAHLDYPTQIGFVAGKKLIKRLRITSANSR